MATMNHLIRDRVRDRDVFAMLRLAADIILTPKTPLAAVWTLDCHGRLACHWEFDLESRPSPSG